MSKNEMNTLTTKISLKCASKYSLLLYISDLLKHLLTFPGKWWTLQGSTSEIASRWASKWWFREAWSVNIKIIDIRPMKAYCEQVWGHPVTPTLAHHHHMRVGVTSNFCLSCKRYNNYEVFWGKYHDFDMCLSRYILLRSGNSFLKNI